ncbi:hypothetical protein ZWY2020_033143 [Hordeum vulgare]|nr:hypothetical protein ZWY2020_033143 [Hordeum vulgare]
MQDDTTWPWFMSLLLAEEVPQVQTNMLPELFPEETLSKEGFEVLSGILACNPDKRLTAAAALKLPWFATIATNARPLASPPASATVTVSVKVEEVEIAPSTLRRKKVTVEKYLSLFVKR